MEKVKKFFVKNWIKIVVVVVIVALAVGGYYGVKAINKRVIEKKLEDIDWLRGNIELVKDKSMGDDIYKVYKNEKISIFNLKYQKIVNEKINELVSTNKDKLVIYNPYGTNKLSFNIYFKDKLKDSMEYTISVDDKKISDFERELVSKDEGNAYQIIGLVPGYKNTISFEGDDDEFEFEIDMSDIEVYSETVLKTKEGKSEEDLSDGLFSILGNDSDADDYMSLYDNDGIVRSEFPIIGYRAHSILFNDDKMYFSISQGRIAEINNMGEITKIFELGQYHLHHDYVFDDDGNLLVLANNTKKDTEEDCIIKIDIKTGQVSEVIDFEEMFESYVDICTLDTTSARDEGEDGLDWLHLNSIEYVDGDVFLSSRETSSILKVRDIYGDQELVYMLGNKEIWKDTDFEKYVYDQEGDFKIHAGQHSVRYFPGRDDEHYYLTFYDNNYGKSGSRPEFDFKTVGIKNNNPFQGDKSYYYTYKVDEEDKTFELVDSFDVEYSGIVSSVQVLDNDNVVVDSGTQGIFGEYDEDHELIRKYTVKMNKYMVYRVLKYDFENFWFED